MPSLPGPMRVCRGLGHPLVPPILLALWLGVIVGVSSWPDPQPPLVGNRGWLAPATHLGLYGGLGVLLVWNLVRRLPRPGPVRGAFLPACALGLLVGMLDEAYQNLVPGRDPSWGDVAVDALGAAIGAGVTTWAIARRLIP